MGAYIKIIMENNYEKFKNTLKTIFQIDRADLDFGIYRILNQKHDEISTFLDNDLLPQVKQELQAYEAGDTTAIETELEKMTAKLKELGVNDEQIATNDKVVELNEKLQSAGNAAELENEVFSHLLRFFERYYEEGDFISKRRYKDGVYSIPYEGEEVKLHWANHDQYYIKTSERFKDFSFKVSGKSVHFRIKEAETDANNNKNISGKDRRFVLCDEDFWSESGNELNLYFQYVAVDGKKKQDECSAEAVEKALSAIPSAWKDILATPAPTEKNKERTVLEKFLTSYTATNTFDYFIHKDLSTFLTRELDFYIKNEVMFLDDIENETAPRADQYLAKLKVIRVVAKKIIRMLAQLEDFQKKLWEKKKFVVGTGYCITLDLVPEQYYDSILNNAGQKAEWAQLGFIDESTELNVEYLKSHPTLSIDTKFFPDWKDELLATFENLDERVNGVMINSENFGALNVLQERYREQIKAIYIDPPYNTDAIPILYKNNYRHSSWLSLLSGTFKLGRSLKIPNQGIYSVAIDDAELDNLGKLISQEFQDHNIMRAIVNHYPGSGTGRSNITRTHEYNLFAVPTGLDELRGKSDEDDGDAGQRERNFRRSGTGENNYRSGRPNSFFAVLVDEKSFEIKGFEAPPTTESYPIEDTESGYKRIYPIGSDGSERVWTLSYSEPGDNFGVQKVFSEGLIYCNENLNIIRVYNDDDNDRGLLKSLWSDKKYSATAQGTNLLKALFGNASIFSYPKSIFTTLTAVDSITHKYPNSITLDYFAGSATTAHAILRLNRIDNERSNGSGMRKFILVEMGSYFDSVTKPRVQKVVYSDDWSAGKPQDDGESGTKEHIMKYFKLESYEDTLNNLKLVRTDKQQATLSEHQSLREEYTLGYMLDVETKNSLLSLESFKNPFAYNIKLATDVVGETKDTLVDLVETFNYLIGLKVATIRKHGEHLLVVEGVTRAGEKTLVIWRNKEVVDNAGLDDFFGKQALSTTDFEYQKIYVNGDNNLENLKADGDQWKVVTIEEEFHKRMFA